MKESQKNACDDLGNKETKEVNGNNRKALGTIGVADLCVSFGAQCSRFQHRLLVKQTALVHIQPNNKNITHKKTYSLSSSLSYLASTLSKAVQTISMPSKKASLNISSVSEPT